MKFNSTIEIILLVEKLLARIRRDKLSEEEFFFLRNTLYKFDGTFREQARDLSLTGYYYYLSHLSIEKEREAIGEWLRQEGEKSPT